ncbi:hypothetical protein PYCC9005_002790 [Savitreella phatthalungensis]
MKADTSISSLPSHGIFTEAGTIKRHAGRPLSLIALSDAGETFLAVGRTIRYAVTKEKDEFEELRGLDIDFDIQALVLNPSRTILLVVGSSRLVAAILPHSSLLAKGTAVRSYIVGEELLRHTTIAQASFHPLSSAGDCLVVLSTDSYLRLFDLSTSFDVADVQVDLLSTGARRGLTGGRGLGDTDAATATAFTFGAGGHGWSGLGVFVLTGEGDVLAASPVLPHTISIDHVSLGKFEGYALQDTVTQASLFARIMTQIEQHGARSLTGISFRRPSGLETHIAISQPLLFEPVPLEFSNRAVEPTDLLFLPHGTADWLALATDDKIDLALIVDDVGLRPGTVITCAVNESISISGTGHITLLPSASDGQLLAIHRGGVHEISVFGGDALARLTEPDEGMDLAPAKIKLVLDCEGSDINGHAVVHEDLDVRFVALLNDYDAHVVNLAHNDILASLDALGIADEPNAETLPEGQDDRDVPRYSSLLTRPTYKPPLSPQLVMPVVPPSLQGGKALSEVTPESLRLLGKAAVAVREAIEQLHRHMVSAHRRLELQTREAERQRAKVDQLARRLERMVEAGDGDQTLERRAEDARARQRDLEKRTTQLLAGLTRQRQQQLRGSGNGAGQTLSAAEKRYFDEIERVRQRLAGTRGLVARAEEVSKTFVAVKTALESSSSGTQGEATATATDKSPVGESRQSPLRTSQLTRIKTQLAAAGETISRTKVKADRLAQALAV